jgi:hypothetical protein
MNQPHDPWQTLIAQARTAPMEATDLSAPLGFATRVVAQWKAAQENPTFAFWQRWSLRGACAAMMAYALVATWSAGNPAPESIPVLDVPGMPGL